MIVRYRDYKGKPGIYKWENLINHKCYIGQSIDLNKRIAHHFSNIKNNRYDSPLYRAIKKYGLENFDVTIIEVLEASDDLKSELDEREKYYIQKYNSYGKNGYNQTFGGDGGILGYKFTEDQRNHVSKNSIKAAEDIKKAVYLFNFKYKYYQTWMDSGYAAKQIGVNRCTIQRLCSGIIQVVKKEWIGSFDKEELETKIHSGIIEKCREKRYGKFQASYIGKFVYRGKEFIGNVKDAAEYFKVSKSYLYGICNKSRRSNILLFIPN